MHIPFLINTCTALKGSVLFLFAISAAGVVLCGGPKKSPRTSSIVQIIFAFCSFEISEGILRNQTINIGWSGVRLYDRPDLKLVIILVFWGRSFLSVA